MYRRLLFIIPLTITSIFYFLTSNFEIKIIIYFFMVVFLSRFGGNRDVLNPISWFPIFMFLYSTFFSLNNYFIWNVVTSVDLKILDTSFIAFLSFVIPVFVVTFQKKYRFNWVFEQIKSTLKPTHYIGYLICVAVSIVYIFSALKSGASSKRELIEIAEGNYFLYIGSVAYYLLSLFFLIYYSKFLGREKYSLLNISFIFLLSVVAYGASGERDILFRLLLTGFIYIMLVQVDYKNRYLFFSSLTLVVMLPITQAMKSFLLGQFELSNSFNESIFSNEFYSAGRNLELIITANTEPMLGLTYLYDLKRFLSFVFPDQASTVSWFNDVYRANYNLSGVSGWGFSLIAEAYLNFREVGVVFFFMLLGLVCSFFYSLASRGLFFLFWYMSSIPVIIYSQRADLAFMLSGILKTGFFVSGLFYIFCFLRVKIK